MSSTTSSLRDLYNPPSSPWAFVPPLSPSHANKPGSPPANTSGSSYQWSTRPPSNAIFDLSPALNGGEPSVNLPLLFRSLVTSALLQYSSTAIAMPLEVGKLLLQIQWVPRDASAGVLEPKGEVEEEEALSDTSNEDESYFVDPGAGLTTRYSAPKLIDDKGYVMRTSVMEDGTRPEYIIPVGSAGGPWGMVKRLVKFRGEGWFALWKGLLTSCIYDVILTNVQPLVDSVLHSCFIPATGGFYRPPLLLPVASHVITGFLLSPLDLVRTRLVAQTSMPRYKSYTGPIHALSDILAREGGLKGVYFHPHLFIPTILDTGIRSFMHTVMPALIAPRLGLGPHVAADTHPVGWAFAEVLGGCVGLLLTLPVETIRRRLQVQSRGTAKPLRTCVETRPVPYNGVVDVFWHILTEERSDLPIRRRTKRRTETGERGEVEVEEVETDEGKAIGGSWLRSTGIGQFYRGLGLRLAAGAIVFLLSTLGGGEDVDGGWAEL
ncbi:mitochondrial carrier domain-containing protein [Phlebopus sp. FC_14]|nr:mitochondrial carrier domain-containing protein [Phlebopus sp. FC_14]